MARTTETLHWHRYVIDVGYDSDPYPEMARRGVAIAYLEIDCLHPVRAALPMTETGYRSAFFPDHYLDGYDGAGDYVRQWLDSAAPTPDWKDILDQARQLCLF
tara:strand:- start:454 stop:762 length:309 start_codon:yes stop_codon:yes gene_type:complete